MDITDLQKKFSRPGRITVAPGQGGLPFIRISNDAAQAEICLQGAHLTSFRCKNQADLLWMCPASYFEAGKPLRGGVPVCWPWFGPHPSDKTMPGHGLARIMMWDLLEIREPSPDLSIAVLELRDSAASRQYWPCSFRLTLEISIGSSLQMSLTTENTDRVPFTVSEALHTYFHVKAVEDITVEGLDGREYFNKVGGSDTVLKQSGILRIDRENDSVFQNFTGPVTIADPGYNRRITIAKTGSQTTVVWNPWIEKSKRMPDFTPDSYHTMICVEAANALDNTYTLFPGEKKTMGFTVNVHSAG